MGFVVSITEITNYAASCFDCAWTGTETGTRSVAEAEAEEHRKEHEVDWARTNDEWDRDGGTPFDDLPAISDETRHRLLGMVAMGERGGMSLAIELRESLGIVRGQRVWEHARSMTDPILAYLAAAPSPSPVAPVTVELRCDMTRECAEPVAWIDEKGWLYCAGHGSGRAMTRECRPLLVSELVALGQGKTIPWRRPG